MPRNVPATRPPGAARSPTGARRLTNPQRVIFTDDGITKGEVAAYYESVARWMLPHIVQRPLSLLRCPKGLASACFYQKHGARTFGPSVRALEVSAGNGSATSTAIAIDDLDGLLALVQMNTLEIHPWGCGADDLDHPTRMVLDLDPGPGVPWAHVVEGAQLVRALLKGMGTRSYVLASGGKGLHVIVPLTPVATWEQVKEFSKAVAVTMESGRPSRYISVMTKSKREGRIFIDYLRNGRGATSIAPYSTRARSHAPVAAPLRWTELASVTSASQFHVRNMLRRMKSMRSDPWPGFLTRPQPLPRWSG